MTSPREPALQLLLDRAEIHDLLMRYAFACDRREFDVQASCFVPDLRGTWGFGSIPDRDTMMDYIHQVARFHTTMHFLGNEFIEVDGDEASLQAFAMLMHRATRRDGTPFQYNPSDRRYSERLERREGHWIIVERKAEPQWAPTGVSAVEASEPAVQWLLDRAEIHDLMASYALGVDLRDYERVRACFAPGFRARYGDHEFDDLDPLIEYISGVEHFVSTTHFMGSQLIEVAGDEAAMRTAAIISQREPPDGERSGPSPAGATATGSSATRAAGASPSGDRTRPPSRARTQRAHRPTTRTFAPCSTARRSRTWSRRSRSRSTGATSSSCAPASRPTPASTPRR